MHAQRFIKYSLTLSALALVLFGAGCMGSDHYTITDADDDSGSKVVRMQGYSDDTEYFTFRFDPELWELQEWEEDEAPNHVVLVHQNYEDESCLIFPGTVGQGYQEGTVVYEGAFWTEKYQGRNLQIETTAGIRVKNVVGYEIGEFAYIFESRLPLKDQEQCSTDAQTVMASFDLDVTEERFNELMGTEADESTEADETDETGESTESGESTVTEEATADGEPTTTDEASEDGEVIEEASENSETDTE